MAWGKWESEGEYHRLENHCADVCACFEKLYEQPVIHERLTKAAGMGLNEDIKSMLSCIAFLHDLGKLNTGFQLKVRDENHFGNHKRPPKRGHVKESVGILCPRAFSGEICEMIRRNLHLHELFKNSGKTFEHLLLASISHHGEPVTLDSWETSLQKAWTPHPLYNPVEEAAEIGSIMEEWFPEAFHTQIKLPDRNEFQHLYAGLVCLADWLGSSRDFFRFSREKDKNYIEKSRDYAEHAVRSVGLSVRKQRKYTKRMSFKDLHGYSPNPMQQSMTGLPMTPSIVILESETGSGKTEAAFQWFEKLYADGKVDGLYFALPTRSAAVQLHERIHAAVGKFFGKYAPETVLAVPGYLKAGEFSGKHLPDWKVLWDDNKHEVEGEKRHKFWSAENAKRYLSAQIAVGTVDQAMLGALQVKHAHLRSASLARNLLVVDEVHASDVYMRAIMEKLLQNHESVGGYALLMSATLGSETRKRWLLGADKSVAPKSTCVETHYPMISFADSGEEKNIPAPYNNKKKHVSISLKEYIDDYKLTAEMSITAARAGAKVIIIRNTVSAAIETQKALESMAEHENKILFSVNDIITIHHGRYSVNDRKILDDRVNKLFGKTRESAGIVLVGTQTLEQSLDIDADFMITDLCPADVLLQRIGRLHRHHREGRPETYANPQCVVLSPCTNLSPYLQKPAHGMGMYDNGRGIYIDLRILEATRRLIENRPVWEIPEMNRFLVENAVHTEALEEISSIDDNWRRHGEEVMGSQIADRQTGLFSVLRWNKEFTGISFSGQDEVKIRTRLGDEGPTLDVLPATKSPLGAELAQLSVPAHLRYRVLVDALELKSAHESGANPQVLEFKDTDLVYCRYGLCSMEQAPAGSSDI